MITGIGIDIVEINRVQTIMERQSKFSRRVLTDVETQLFESLTKSRQVEFLAGRFAAKEAYAKAKGTGFGKCLSFLDIEILPNELGKPVIHVQSQSDQKNETIHLSISHSKDFAVAQVVIEKI